LIHEQYIKEIITDQFDQLKHKSRGIQREIDYDYLITGPFISVITGIRRCGKSTLLLQLTNHFDKYYYVNFDDERFYNFEIDDFKTLMLVLKQRSDAKTIFIDEIQNVIGWERFVRRLHDEGYKIFVTGSNSKLLSSELSTHLTGRYVKLELFPFSFSEYLTIKNVSFSEINSDKKSQILKHFDRYLMEGGFPEFTRYGNQQHLQNIYKDIIYKDLITRFSIKNTKALKQLAHFFYTNFTNEISYNSLKSILAIKSTTTIKDYTDYLQQSYLLFECYRFDYSLKKQISYYKKIYTIDNGLRNSISFRFNTDVGQLLENIVFLQLRKRYSKVWFYKTGKNHEVDFVVQAGTIQMYQVSYVMDNPNTRQREIRSLIEASEELNTKSAFILTYNSFETINIEGLNIEVLPVWHWLIIYKAMDND
jgi:predicted AAA+ superfamily ATPase